MTLSWDHFAEAAGTAYEVEAGGHRLELVLEQAESLPSAGREGGSFRLEFRGPSDPLLPQAIYPFRHGEAGFEMFIVPISRDAAGTRYEAIFN